MPSNFPDLEKGWKIGIKSWKMVKSLELFFKATNCCKSELFFVLIRSYSISAVHACLQCIMKKLCSCFSIDHLFDNLGPVVRRSISANLRLNFNPGFLTSSSIESIFTDNFLYSSKIIHSSYCWLNMLFKLSGSEIQISHEPWVIFTQLRTTRPLSLEKEMIVLKKIWKQSWTDFRAKNLYEPCVNNHSTAVPVYFKMLSFRSNKQWIISKSLFEFFKDLYLHSCISLKFNRDMSIFLWYDWLVCNRAGNQLFSQYRRLHVWLFAFLIAQ